MNVESCGQILSGFRVNIKELLTFISKSIVHVRHVIQSLQIIARQTHISSYFTFIDALCQHRSGISHNKLIEFNPDQLVATYKLP